jgi:hypothetical protein
MRDAVPPAASARGCSGGLDQRLKPAREAATSGASAATGRRDAAGVRLTISTAQFVNRPSSIVNFTRSRVIVPAASRRGARPPYSWTYTEHSP